MNLMTRTRIVIGMVSPLAVALTALVLDQSNLVDIPWIGGAIAVVVVAGLICGLLLRSLWAVTYIFVLWLIWAVVALATDEGSYDPPVEAMILFALPMLVFPAAFGAFVGALVSSAWTERSATRKYRSG